MPKDNLNWKNKTLLIAEDNLSNYKIVEQLLKKTQVKIIWAETGSEVLFFLKHPELKIDAILMDINIPEMNGLEATQHVKHNFPQMPVIGLSTYMNNELLNNSIQLFDDSLLQPIDQQTLLSTLGKYFSPQ